MKHSPRSHTESTTSRSEAPESVAAPCKLCTAPVGLDDGPTLRMRHATSRDQDGLRRLYDRLSNADLHRRFFSGARPSESFLQKWTTIESRGGLALVVELEDGPDRRVVAEAGYAPLEDGEVELGITVDPAHRGWIGPWLLDAVVVHAHDRGIANIQARVLADNGSMLSLADRRGFVVLDHPEFSEVRLTMSTGDSVPTFPGPKRRLRVVVESNRTRFRAENELRAAGFEVAICRGASRKCSPCPLLQGDPCPLLAGADAAIVDLPPGDPVGRELLEAERILHPGLLTVLGIGETDTGDARPLAPTEILHELEGLGPVEPEGHENPDPDNGRTSCA